MISLTTILQIVAALAALTLVFGDKLLALVKSRSRSTPAEAERVDHLKSYAANLVDIADHFAQAGMQQEADAAIDLIKQLTRLPTDPMAPVPTPAPAAPVNVPAPGLSTGIPHVV